MTVRPGEPGSGKWVISVVFLPSTYSSDQDESVAYFYLLLTAWGIKISSDFPCSVVTLARIQDGYYKTEICKDMVIYSDKHL